MPKLIWTLGSCKEEAAKYTTRTQFSNAAGGAYNKALYENWVVRKTRLLSRQRKVARDVFKSIENGTFP